VLALFEYWFAGFWTLLNVAIYIAIAILLVLFIKKRCFSKPKKDVTPTSK